MSTPPPPPPSSNAPSTAQQQQQQHQQPHEAPSAPASPLAKRPRTMAAAESAPATTKVEDAPSLLVKKLSGKARAPTRGSAQAAGYDLYAYANPVLSSRGKAKHLTRLRIESAQATTIPGHGKALVETDLAIAVPAGTYGRIAPRSGLASKHHLATGAGVIDADYRGPVKVLLFNHGADAFEVGEGERVAQLVLERIYTPAVVVVEELEESVRGAAGFGSTG
ncbi:MAG: Deoxyuridine 5'-triphosphate nucleotidohydrolase [Thelocarpon impressellum]|nr:MAG: Deoxyuridine 5'-triphosphate nucleotidohydrolase [Thelocarpon impressellum]